MLIAKIQNKQVVDVADYQSMFPMVSFPPSGPSDSFMVENGCMYVNVWLPYDQSTQVLQSCAPYIQADDATHWVYTVEVRDMTQEEKEAYDNNLRQQNKAQAESLLQTTDWTATVDINNPQYSDPYLANQAEFLAYRSNVRKIAVNPPVVVDEWPVKPEEVWVGTEPAPMGDAVNVEVE